MWQFCIDHSLVSAVLALFVWSIGRSLRKPAIAHALWLIVLLKLMTPPLVAVPVWNDWPAGNQQRPATGQNAKTGTLSTTEPSPSPRIPEITEATIELPTRFLVEPDFAWQAALLTVWLSGSIVWLFCRLRHAVRFAERMNDAQPAASALRDRADRLARLIGLKQAPRVVVVPAVISPMLW
ncbi:MAG: hypothetical protein EHM42_01235, partial [Planctomycetaceae bacterium]